MYNGTSAVGSVHECTSLCQVLQQAVEFLVVDFGGEGGYEGLGFVGGFAAQ